LDAERTGDRAAAVERWRVLAVHDPYSSRFALGLVKALAAAGDPAAALRQARVHEALLRSELNAEPPAEFAAAVAALARPALANTTAIPAARPRPEPIAEPIVRATHGSPQRSFGPRLVWAAAGVTAIAIAAMVLITPDRSANPAPTALAVIPFVDLSPGDAQAYFADGITEELINRLAQVEGLRVPSRTSVFALRDRGLDVRELGRRLGVGTVLEGSVRTAGTRFRITAQLTDAHNGYHLWSSTYDREMADVLAIQDEIARAIVATLRERLGAQTGDPAGPVTAVDPRAYELYLRGRYHWHRRTQADLERATADFGEATRIAPGYARAWAGLADAYAILGFYDFMPPREAFPRAREAAERAFDATEVQGEAAATRAYVLLYHDWRWQEAEEWFRRAVDLEPKSSKAAQWYGNFLTARGRFDEAEREMRRSQELEPLSLIASAALGWVFYYARRYDDAIAQLDATLALDSTFFLAHLWRGQTWERMGRADSALAALGRAAVLSDSGTLALSALALAHGSAGDRPSAARLYRELRDRRARGYEAAYELAKAALGAGQRSEALRWLEQAVDDRAHSIAFLEVDPQLDPLRREPRFDALRRRAGT
jgi:TolB-like protein/Tfp pilus assembly protein PilF